MATTCVSLPLANESTPIAERSDAEPAVTDFLVTWDPDVDSDATSPRCMSKRRKWMIVWIVSHASFCVTAFSSVYTASYDKMEHTLGNSRFTSLLGLSAFVVGLGCGPLFFSPLSEFYGRRPVYLVAWSLFLIWIVPQAVANHIAIIIIGRFMCGFSGTTFLAVSGGTVHDLFNKNELQYPMAIFSVSPFLGPCIGPALGGVINYYTDWRWTYYVLIIWAAFLLLTIVFFVPETYHPVLLRNKARGIRLATGDSRFKSRKEDTRNASVLKTIGRSPKRPFQLLIFEPMCLCLCVFCSILLGILYLFFGAFPLIFRTLYDFNLWQIGLSFLGIGVGLIVGVLTDPIWRQLRISLLAKHKQKNGVDENGEPEFRLPQAIGGSILVPVGLFIFAWTTQAPIHWIVPIIGSAIFGVGNILVFAGIFTFLVDAYPDCAASALAANAFLRCAFAAAFPLFGGPMYQSLGFQWASSVLAFLTLAMMPFPYLFFRFGKRIRAKSRYAARSQTEK